MLSMLQFARGYYEDTKRIRTMASDERTTCQLLSLSSLACHPSAGRRSKKESAAGPQVCCRALAAGATGAAYLALCINCHGGRSSSRS